MQIRRIITKWAGVFLENAVWPTGPVSIEVSVRLFRFYAELCAYIPVKLPCKNTPSSIWHQLNSAWHLWLDIFTQNAVPRGVAMGFTLPRTNIWGEFNKNMFFYDGGRVSGRLHPAQKLAVFAPPRNTFCPADMLTSRLFCLSDPVCI